MNTQLTELVFILDRSGSMHGLEKDTLGGFNSMMEKQKKGEGNALVTTALLDAVGSTIHRIGTVHKYARPEDVPAHTLVVIITDGEENSSRFYDYEDVRHMVEREKSKYGWEFIFLEANMDAIEAAADLGIHEDRAAQFLCDKEGIQKNFEAVDDFCDHFVEPISVDWKKGIEEDFKRRGRK